jgi:hypothetical protein
MTQTESLNTALFLVGDALADTDKQAFGRLTVQSRANIENAMDMVMQVVNELEAEKK